jgi:hypothetical protein
MYCIPPLTLSQFEVMPPPLSVVTPSTSKKEEKDFIPHFIFPM